MKLSDLLIGVDFLQIIGDVDTVVRGLAFDSRELLEGDVFVAVKGGVVDGHQYIDKAISSGVSVIVCEVLPNKLSDGLVYVEVVESKKALAYMASNFYGNPSRDLTLVGVTGTNGKTTVASLLYQLFSKAGYKVGLLSTVKVMVAGEEYKSTYTTPDSISINKYISLMVNEGCEYCFMEVSSHGIHQQRIAALNFDGGVFTNLTHDHLDYHNSFAEYRDVKKHFFDELPKSAFALVNVDDKNGVIMLQNTKAVKCTYALKTMADYKAKILEKQFSGMLMSVNGVELWTRLIGEFNAYNVLAICGVAERLGLERGEVLRLVSELESVRGRFEYLVSNGIVAIVDYAHTPNALRNVLETINDIRTGKESLITVVGCGGDRDVEKRPKMGMIGSQLSSQVIFTSDNPRREDPQEIIDAMEKGVAGECVMNVLSILNRGQAIKAACRLAKVGDIILIAGKGHEDYQEINGERIHFSDMEEVLKNLK